MMSINMCLSKMEEDLVVRAKSCKPELESGILCLYCIH